MIDIAKTSQLKKERDALLEACKLALDEMEHLEAHEQLSYFDLDKLKAAIKLAEGGLREVIYNRRTPGIRTETDETMVDNAIRIADHHRKTCEGAECNMSLSILSLLFDRAGITLTTEERSHFL